MSVEFKAFALKQILFRKYAFSQCSIEVWDLQEIFRNLQHPAYTSYWLKKIETIPKVRALTLGQPLFLSYPNLLTIILINRYIVFQQFF